MPLKTITGVKTSEQKPAAKSDIPLIRIKGDLIKRYNDTKERLDEAEATLKALRPFVLDEALPAIYAHNCDPNCLAPVTSVKIEDAKEELACVQFQNRYSAIDPEPAETFFEEAGVDINKYVAETLVASFDSTIFTDADGNFNKKVYDKFRLAIESVARDLKLQDKDGLLRVPLSVRRVVKPRPAFHELRFKDFDQEQQVQITEVLPNTTAIKPERTKGKNSKV